MKTRTLKKDKVNIITLGCSKNMVDSEVLLVPDAGTGKIYLNKGNIITDPTDITALLLQNLMARQKVGWYLQ
jgi:hypothetical protein